MKFRWLTCTLGIGMPSWSGLNIALLHREATLASERHVSDDWSKLWPGNHTITITERLLKCEMMIIRHNSWHCLKQWHIDRFQEEMLCLCASCVPDWSSVVSAAWMWLSNQRWATVILFWVRVPVLSEQITEVEPKHTQCTHIPMY